MVLIFNLQNKKSKYDDNDDPDNKVITATEINQKFYSFCGKVFDKIYWEQL